MTFARSTDPWTSWAAAHSIDAERLREYQKQVLWLVATHGPMPDVDLLQYAELHHVIQSPSGLRTRRKELTVMGYIVADGYTTRGTKHRQHIVWRIADRPASGQPIGPPPRLF